MGRSSDFPTETLREPLALALLRVDCDGANLDQERDRLDSA